MSSPKLRDWFYYRARQATGQQIQGAGATRPKASIVIGDAVRAGKSKPAITSAFEAALLPNPGDSGP